MGAARGEERHRAEFPKPAKAWRAPIWLPTSGGSWSGGDAVGIETGRRVGSSEGGSSLSLPLYYVASRLQRVFSCSPGLPRLHRHDSRRGAVVAVASGHMGYLHCSGPAIISISDEQGSGCGHDDGSIHKVPVTILPLS